ncbi:MAG: sugar phosphate nucleotidyltransferase [Gammaproteobacteria bacterium]
MLFADLNDTLTLVLAIGDGKSLDPLTARRATAAMPFGGSYRVIDFALTNCLHSGLRRILVMTQYNGLSLHNHIRDGWSIYNTDLGEFITPVTPPVGSTTSTYAGSADALQKNLYLLDGASESHVLIVSGEQVYRMDYAALLSWHKHTKADVTLGCVPREQVNGGSFSEALECDGDDIVQIHRAAAGDIDEQWLPAMGVCVIRRERLIDLLDNVEPETLDTASIGELVGEHLDEFERPSAYRFGGSSGRVSQDKYWRRLDSLDDYYSANMDLLELDPPLDLYQSNWPIRTYQTQRPPARTVPGRSINEGICVNSIVSGGTVIAGGGVNHSVLGNRVYIDDGATVEDSILFSDVHIGDGAQIRRCICDRGVVVPSGEQIGFESARDAERFTLTDAGVVVVPADFSFE